MDNFDVFISKNYPGLNYLSISLASYAPGQVINNDDRVVDSLQRIFPTESPASWTMKRIKASLPGKTISGTKEMDADASILGIFSLKAGVSAAYSLSFRFEEATALIFDDKNGGLYENQIRALIMNLKKSDRSRWKDILHQHVIMESIYVESVKVSFKRNGKVVTQADLPIVQNEVSVNGSFTWLISGEMAVSNNM